MTIAPNRIRSIVEPFVATLVAVASIVLAPLPCRAQPDDFSLFQGLAAPHCEEPGILLFRGEEVERFAPDAAADVGVDLIDADTVWFCPGEYEVNTERPLVVQSRSDIRIYGAEATLSSREDMPILQLYGSQRVSVYGLRIVHHLGTESCAANCIEIDDSSEVAVMGCDIDGSGFYGIAVTNAQDVVISENRIHNCEYGLFVGFSEGLRVENNQFDGNRSDDFDIYTQTGATSPIVNEYLIENQFGTGEPPTSEPSLTALDPTELEAATRVIMAAIRDPAAHLREAGELLHRDRLVEATFEHSLDEATDHAALSWREVGGLLAGFDPRYFDVTQLVAGETLSDCSGRCCRVAIDELMHNTLFLEEACFVQLDDRLVLETITFVDGD
jgi:parallel beta-helix repeat protein